MRHATSIYSRFTCKKILNIKYGKHNEHSKDESDGSGQDGDDVDIHNYNEISCMRMLSK
jgi:hypothetical protein